MTVFIQLIQLKLSILACFVVYVVSRKKFPEYLKNMLVKRGPVYIKIGQVMSTRVDVLPESVIKALSDLRDKVYADNLGQYHHIIETRLIGKGITQYSKNCIAAGSVAVVFSAYDEFNNKVAIKIIRPGIETVLQENFNVIKKLITLFELFSSRAKSINIRGIVIELEELLLSQMDLTKEGDNYELFRKTYKNNKSINVPRVYSDLTEKNILVTEYVDGICPYDFGKIGLEAKGFARKVDRIFDEMVFIKGVAHADMHPGNFFLTKSGDFILIDIGLAHRFSQEERNNIMAFYYAFVEEHYDIATNFFLENFLIETTKRIIYDENGNIKKDLFKEVYLVVKSQSVDTGGNPQFSTIFNKLMNLMYRHKLQLVSNYSKMLLTLVTIEGYLYSIDPEFNMVENARLTKMELAEYTSIPDEAEQLVLEDYGTYSTARFENTKDPREAYVKRDELIFDVLNLRPGDILLDVGCGRGKLLQKATQKQLRPIGVTIDKVEHQVCKDKGLECVCTSWEEFDINTSEDFPKVDAITAIEVLNHLGNMNENRAGLVDRRLENFFKWTTQRTVDNGKLFIQVLNIQHSFLFDDLYKKERLKIEAKVPWLGFTMFDQLQKHSSQYYDMTYREDHAEDLLPTFNNQFEKIKTNEKRLRQLLKADLFEYILDEIGVMIYLSEKGYLRLNRILMNKKLQHATTSIAA